MIGTTYFKVVDQQTRHGSNYLGFIQHEAKQTKYGYRMPTFEDVVSQDSFLRSLFPCYAKGETLTANKETPGFFVFEYEQQALSFANRNFFGHIRFRAEVIKVLSDCEPETVILFVCNSFNIRNLVLQQPEHTDINEVYQGACCLRTLTVLD